MPLRLRWPAVVFGLGLAFLLDVVIFHDLLQWHHTISARTGDLAANLVADGVLELLAVALMVLGAAGMATMPSTRGRFIGGSALLGLGAGNLVDAVVSHWVLGLHHIHPAAPFVSDLAFFVLALVLFGAGWALLAEPGGTSRKRSATPPA